MLYIQKCPVPEDALLFVHLKNGAYVDCYMTELPEDVSFPNFIMAFYTTWLFKLERLILRWMVSRPSTDEQARWLADGRTDRFAAWHVEDRRENEILLSDFRGRTRSWLMVVPINASCTRLYFGSAVVPVQNPKTGRTSMGFVFRALLGFHQIYSRLLLYSARKNIPSKYDLH